MCSHLTRPHSTQLLSDDLRSMVWPTDSDFVSTPMWARFSIESCHSRFGIRRSRHIDEAVVVVSRHERHAVTGLSRNDFAYSLYAEALEEFSQLDIQGRSAVDPRQATYPKSPAFIARGSPVFLGVSSMPPVENVCLCGQRWVNTSRDPSVGVKVRSGWLASSLRVRADLDGSSANLLAWEAV